MRRTLALPLLIALTLALLPAPSSARTWCASPLIVHEWGVHVFNAGGGSRTGPGIPSYFHRSPTQPQALGEPVREMEVDGGERELPVLHFYAPRGDSAIPLGLEVGVTHGRATVWYPQVDVQRSAGIANGTRARRARMALLAARRARGASGARSPLGSDPTRQLVWDHLSLTPAPLHPLAAANSPWVDRVRSFDSALWVNTLHESERFAFYEGETSERAPIVVTRGGEDAPGHRHLILRNTSTDDVHDIFFLHREGALQFAFLVPTIPAGRSAGFILDDHPVGDLAVPQAEWRTRLVDGHAPSPPTSASWEPCVMMRDPAIPVESAEGHQLYAHEIDAILEAWATRFFDGEGTRILYREAVTTLDRETPLSLYTDMFHQITLRRLGLGLIEGISL